MEYSTVREIAEVAGIASLVASLIFVGLQLRQAQKTSISEVYTARAQVAAEWNNAVAANPDVLSAIRKSIAEVPEEIGPREFDAAFFTINGLLFLYDNNFFQYEQGLISKDYWGAARAGIKQTLKIPIVREIIVGRSTIARPAFQNELLSIFNELDAEAAATGSEKINVNPLLGGGE